MSNITPGTLCLVVGGPDTGLSVTALKIVDREILKKALEGACGFDVKVGFRQAEIWEVDKPTLWVSSSGAHKCKIPYEMRDNLLPIPPLADPLNVKQEEELKV